MTISLDAEESVRMATSSPSSGLSFYQPDLPLLKFAKNSGRCPIRRGKEFNILTTHRCVSVYAPPYPHLMTVRPLRQPFTGMAGFVFGGPENGYEILGDHMPA
jgi:hypothetical protein